MGHPSDRLQRSSEVDTGHRCREKPSDHAPLGRVALRPHSAVFAGVCTSVFIAAVSVCLDFEMGGT